ncbi:ScbR family autoregulator-binding transcription factor [Streptomyces sp. NPDC050439]|uniref:ScbR family autoregulator-binding transcription factor n=1 Tax=unclassified Streptomyces TaxID=2593676 RepID=UPI00341E821F
MTKQERAVRTRSQLIVAAAHAFDRHGFTRTNLTSVSGQVGVSSGALYFHFDNKEALATEVVSQASGALRDAARRVYRASTSPLQCLIDTSHTLAELLRSDPVVKAGFRLNCAGHGGGRTDLRQEWQLCVQRLLAEAAREDALSPGTSRQSIVAAVVAATVGFEVLGRDDFQWLSRHSLGRFWSLQLPCIAAPETLTRLTPFGCGDGCGGHE